jgi:hypothetical protein
MKTFYTMTLVVLLGTTALAQISITSADLNAIKNTTITYATHTSTDFTGLSAVIAATGSGRTWDLTGRTYSFQDSTSTTYLDYPAGAPMANDFSHSNLVLRQVNKASATTTTWSFYRNQSDKFEFFGFVYDSSGTQVKTAYSSAVQVLKYPAALNATWTSSTSLTVSGVTTNLTYEYKVDGEGTVTTPEGSFACLRLELKVSSVTTVFGFTVTTVNYVYTFLNKERTFATITTNESKAPLSVSYWRKATAPAGSAPAVPTLVAPADGATGVATNVTLSWNAVTGATSYDVQVSTSSNFSTTVVNQLALTTTSLATTSLQVNTTYYWRVRATNSAGSSNYSPARSFTTAAPLSVERSDAVVPDAFRLLQNYPNPFNPATRLEFHIPTQQYVRLSMYDALGRELATLVQSELPPGVFRATWDAQSFPSGMYTAVLRAGNVLRSIRMVLTK